MQKMFSPQGIDTNDGNHVGAIIKTSKERCLFSTRCSSKIHKNILTFDFDLKPVLSTPRNAAGSFFM